ncbi:hypothetical protein D3867_22190 (plasmid) [Azospirillum argentinense]|uniref:Uncharacterized protein n=1 Tax=Azospirillum brasilense TaxID=192 RepID=A0A4D8Q9M0_AZOBR|nr:hypothetical protein D3867_22190 [Azospirillum argentinense]
MVDLTLPLPGLSPLAGKPVIGRSDDSSFLRHAPRSSTSTASSPSEHGNKAEAGVQLAEGRTSGARKPNGLMEVR